MNQIDKLISLKDRVNIKCGTCYSLVFENNGTVSLEDMRFKRTCVRGMLLINRSVENMIIFLQDILNKLEDKKND